MVRGPQPENANPTSLLWCRDDALFKRNFQHAKASAKENKKSLGLDFNPGPSAPRADGSRDAEPNVIGPFSNLDSLITYILVQGDRVDHSDHDADTDEAPAPPPKPHVRSHWPLHLLKTVCSLKINPESPRRRRRKSKLSGILIKP